MFGKLIVAVGLTAWMPVIGAREPRPLPGLISSKELQDFGQLNPARQRFIKISLEEAARWKLNRYLYGSADPERGGFDCSGAVFYQTDYRSISYKEGAKKESSSGEKKSESKPAAESNPRASGSGGSKD